MGRKHDNQTRRTQSKQINLINNNNKDNKISFNDYNSEDGIILNQITHRSENDESHNFKNGIILNQITYKSENDENHNNIFQWILDSGSSVHIISSKNYLKNTENCNEQIVLPNGKIVLSPMRGDFFGYLNNAKFILKDVFYVPEINKNIISVSKLT